MKMNPKRNRSKARASPVSGVLCGSSTMISEQGLLYLHRHPNAVLNEQGLNEQGAIETSFRTTPLKVVWEHMLLSTLHRTHKRSTLILLDGGG
ncbi:hypothetical protein EV1_021913 [Malus domestica]